MKSSSLPEAVAVHEDEFSVVPLRLDGDSDDKQEGLSYDDREEEQGGSGDRDSAAADSLSTAASGSGSAPSVGARDSGSSRIRSIGGHSSSVVVERWLSVQLFNANNLLDLSRNK